MSHKIGQPLDASEFIAIFLIIFSFFISVYLLRMYRKTNLKDYLYLFSIFFFLFLNTFSFIIRHKSDPSITLWILNLTLINIVYFSGLLHFLSIRSNDLSKPVMNTAIILMIILFIPKLFATLQLIPLEANLLGIPIFVRTNIAGKIASALKIGGIYIVGDGMQIISIYFKVIILIYGIRTYFKVQPSIDNSKTKRVRRIWIFTIMIWLIQPIGDVLAFHFNNQILSSQLFQLLGGVVSVLLLGFIVWRYPYSLILTKEQLVRARDLYKVVVVNKGKGRTLKSLRNYLQDLPPELTQLLESTKSIS